ncbi:MAG: FKBP-type peptidyl-prolyl cis-trans isomerase [Saprospiraceae bacterium]|nr:FKBP-type peptidyl-prolyl cis-trans isomerase [Saprospiraceae bacterium]
MIKKILFSAFVILGISCAQNDGGQKVTPSGYTYTHLKTDGQKVKEGDYVYISIKMVGSDGKVLQDISEGPNLPVLQMPTADKPLPTPNPVIEMLLEGALGDSMTMIMPIDSLPNSSSNPNLAGMDHIKYVMCLKEIKDEGAYLAEVETQRLEAEKEMEESKARMDEVGKQTEQLIRDFNAGKLEVKSTDTGLKYHVLEEGDGLQGEAGKRAAVHYYGAFMDGKMFDTSFRRGAPYTFTVGRGEVIPGWDQGIPLFKKGGKGILFVPYTLAYGEAGKPPSIPEKSDLAFYVELTDVN